MARASAVTSFLDGFNAGWDTVGKVGTAYGLKKLDSEEERITEGLKADPESGKYSIFGMNFDEAPDQYQISEARNMAQAKVYDRYGDSEAARGLRSDAQTSRKAGLDYKTGQQTFDFNAENNPQLLNYQRTLNTNAAETGKGLALQNDLDGALNPLKVQDANLGLDVKRAELANLERALEQAKLTDPLAVREIEARILQIRSNTKATDISSEAAIEALRQARETNPDLAEQLRLTIDQTKSMGEAQLRAVNQALKQADLTNPLEIKKLTATIQDIIAGTKAKNIENQKNEATQTSDIAAKIASNKAVLNQLPEQLRLLVAQGDTAELALALNKSTFDTRLASMETALKISKQELKRMIKEDPARLQGLLDTNILLAMNIDSAKLDLNQKQAVFKVNDAYRAAVQDGDFSGVEQTLMPFAAKVYNDSAVKDDENKAVQGDDGKFYIVGPNGETIGLASDILQSLPVDQKRDLLRKAQAYSIANITGDNSGIQQMDKTEALITYQMAQVKALETGKGLTKDQWAMQLLAENPKNPLALAMLTGDNFEAVGEAMKDLQNVLGQDDVDELPNGGIGNGNGGKTSANPPSGDDLLTAIGTGDLTSLVAQANKNIKGGKAGGGLGAAANNKNKLIALTENVGALDQAIATIEAQVEAANAEAPGFGKGLIGQNNRKTKLTTLLSQLIDQRSKLNQN